MYIRSATDVAITMWLPAAWGRRRRMAVDRPTAGKVALTHERRLFECKRTTFRLVRTAVEKVYGALRLEPMKRSVRETPRTLM